MIQFINVTVKHSDSRGIKNISFRIHKGQFIYLMGPSGAGKSTIIKTIQQSIKINSGQVIVDEQDISKLNNFELAFYRRNIGMVCQDFKLLNDRTVFDNIALPLRIEGYPYKDIIRLVKESLLKIDLNTLIKYPTISSFLSYYYIFIYFKGGAYNNPPFEYNLFNPRSNPSGVLGPTFLSYTSL